MKLNCHGFKQQRILIITNKAIYSLKPNFSLRRRTDIRFIQGISISKYTMEFIIHCSGIEHDFWYETQKRLLIIEMLATGYETILSSSLKICELENKNLMKFVTWKKEKYKDLSYTKMPTKYISSKDFLFGNMSNIKTNSGNKNYSGEDRLFYPNDLTYNFSRSPTISTNSFNIKNSIEFESFSNERTKSFSLHTSNKNNKSKNDIDSSDLEMEGENSLLTIKNIISTMNIN